uniref:Uncharacterized protein n=1 Tax=Triticum urartu TaxID=4572 RepID=A0A8R7UE07_TRIUA
ATGKEKEGVEKMMNPMDRESAKLVVDDQEEEQGEPIVAVVGKVLHVNTITDALRPA